MLKINLSFLYYYYPFYQTKKSIKLFFNYLFSKKEYYKNIYLNLTNIFIHIKKPELLKSFVKRIL